MSPRGRPRRLGGALGVALLVGASFAATAVAHGPDPILGGGLYAQNLDLGFRWAGGPPADMKDAVKAAAADANASRRSKAPTFGYDADAGNVVTYGTDVPCGVNGLACMRRDPPGWFGVWFRENGHRFDWGTLRWCELSGGPDGCYQVRNVMLDELGHVLVLDHHDNFGDDRDYDDAVVQTYSRTKPRAGWNAHDFGRCDVATLQQQYDVPSATALYSTCLDVPTELSIIGVEDGGAGGRDGDVQRDPRLGRQWQAVEQRADLPDGRPPAAPLQWLERRRDDGRRIRRCLPLEPQRLVIARLPRAVPQTGERGPPGVLVAGGDRHGGDRLPHPVSAIRRRPRPMTTSTVERHAPHYVVWLTTLVFVVAGCTNATGTPAASDPATTTGAPGRPSADASPTAGAPAEPSESPVVASAPPADATAPPQSTEPQSTEPPEALLVGGAGGPARGALGTFSWDGLVSDSPWIVPRSGVPVAPGDGLRVRFDPGPGQASWTARWARIRDGEATRPRAGGSGDGGRVVVEAPADAGEWSLQVEARFAGGDRATWYWRVSVGG